MNDFKEKGIFDILYPLVLKKEFNEIDYDNGKIIL